MSKTENQTKELVKCESCDDMINDAEALYTTVYSNAFDETGKEYLFCCDTCESNYLEDEFYCDECGRTICNSYGHNMQYRMTEKLEQICLQCYEKQLYKEGLTESVLMADLENKNISGMFFNDGDLESEGFEPVKENFVRSYDSITNHNQTCLNLIEEGYLVITELKALGIMGGEGHIKIWRKKKEE